MMLRRAEVNQDLTMDLEVALTATAGRTLEATVTRVLTLVATVGATMDPAPAQIATAAVNLAQTHHNPKRRKRKRRSKISHRPRHSNISHLHTSS